LTDLLLRLKKINLTNFRIYSNIEIKTDYDILFLTGPNGAGKTSILEAISMAGTLRSFRKCVDKDMIKWNSDFYAVDIDFLENKDIHNLHLGYGKPPNHDKTTRSLRYNKEKLNKISDFVGKFQTVVFSPDDIEIIDTTPAERRRFIDITLASVDNKYINNLQKYKKSLQLRSFLLRNNRSTPIDKNYLNSIDSEMIPAGIYIQQKREEFIKQFQPYFEKYVALISNERDKWQIKYNPSVKDLNSVEEYKKTLEKSLPDDLRLRKTTKGNHLDRLIFHVPDSPGLELKQTASQGQKRTAALALKMAQFSYAKEASHKTPVCLIDDVLNELDKNRRLSFLRFLSEIGQAIITTTDMSGLGDFQKNMKTNSMGVFEINNSELKQIT